MITIFSNPRPFKGRFDRIQRNAIKSWQQLNLECQIILFEDEEETTSKVACELGVQCIKDVATNEYGTPLLHDVFKKVKVASVHQILAQVNTDIILFNNFVAAVENVVRQMKEVPFFMSGRRYDLDFNETIDFRQDIWRKNIIDLKNDRGKLHAFSGMDYWIFPKSLDFDPPAFVVGRPGMDSWLIFKCRSLGVPVIDATQMVTIIHQNHNYPTKKLSSYDIESAKNIELAGGFSRMMTLREANFVLYNSKVVQVPLLRYLYGHMVMWYPFRCLLVLKRTFQNKFGHFWHKYFKD